MRFASHSWLLALTPLTIIVGVMIALVYPGRHEAAFASALNHRPNIILIIADDIGWNDYGFMNTGSNHHPAIQTPNIDELAREGVVFNNAYAPNSICRPSLASIITGLYPNQHGITANARPLNLRRGEYDIGLPPYAKRMNNLDTLPRELSKLGYRSYQAGKWWEEGYANGGFDDGDKKPEGLFRHVTRTNTIGREGLDPLFNFIDQNKQQPFFIWYAPQMPHTPHNPPEKFLSLYTDKTNDMALAKYWGMVTWFDDTIGQIIEHMQAQGLYDNTIIVYLSDNGVSMQDEIQNAGANDGKDSPYEMGNRTPVIFRWPAHWQPAQRDAPISNIDIFPTIMDALQQPVHTVSGHSVLSTIMANTAPLRDYVVGESYVDPGKEVFDSPRKFRWIRRNDGKHEWKLIAYRDRHIEMFDLAQDAGEKNNLADAPELQTVKNTLLLILNQTLPETSP
jgi:uncharacterized sulfatase